MHHDRHWRELPIPIPHVMLYCNNNNIRSDIMPRHFALPACLVLAIPLAHADNNQAVSSAAGFNPQISLILDGNIYHDNQNGGGAGLLEEMAGIGHGAAAHGHGHGGLENGFNLGESELVMSAVVDPYFDGKLTLTVGGDGTTALEEAWLQTRQLPAGLKVKMGKFLSEIGYQNNQHPHAWEFADQNLAYMGILGDHGLMDAGAQLSWVAPAPFYALFGIEALQGNDQEKFGTLIENADTVDLVTAAITDPLPEHRGGPRLTTAFLKLAPDLGDVHALQVGLSFAKARQFQQIIDEDGTAQSSDEYALDGDQTLTGLDLVYKRDSAGEYGAGDFKLAAEYLHLEKSMTVTAADAGSPLATGDKVDGQQDGYYLQASYGIAPRWQIGLRHDVNGDTNELVETGTQVAFRSSQRQTLALSFHPSEFSRLRLQAAQGDIYDETGAKTALKQIFLQYTHSLGPHGAHKF